MSSNASSNADTQNRIDAHDLEQEDADRPNGRTDLGRRAEAIRTRAVAPEEDNMLKVSGDGRRAALDLRLAGLPQTVPGKITAAARRISAIWHAHRDDEYLAPAGTPYPVRGSLQLVFCDLGTPGPGWNAYDELRQMLTVRGRRSPCDCPAR